MSSERLPYERWLEYRYTRPLPVMNRIFVGVWVALWIVAAAVALIQRPEMCLPFLAMLVFVPVFLADRRQAILEIGKKSMLCEVAPGRRASIAWQSVTELRESHFDLGIVHLVHSDYARVSLPKAYFKEEHWRQIIGAISERVLSHAPGALVEIDTLTFTEDPPLPQ